MAVDFRCEKCGKLLSAAAPPGSVVRCHHCDARITIPAALASLPRPQVPAAVQPATGQPRSAVQTAPAEAPPQGEPAEDEQEQHEGEAVMTVMARAMPWVVSLFIHAGALLLLSFILILAQQAADGDDILFPSANLTGDPGGVVNPGQQNPDLQAQQPAETPQKQWSKVESQVQSSDSSQKQRDLQFFGVGGGGASGGQMAMTGLTGGGAGSGPRSNFYGTGGNAYHVVFVVDRSGSMNDTLDLVKLEMLRTIAGMQDVQNFHVIFFAEGAPEENPPQRLVPATKQNKLEAASFLQTISAVGRTNPVPAMERAFAVLGRADAAQKGKLIYLLTDGEFPDNKAVLDLLARLNRDKSVMINTILHMHRSPSFEQVLQQIARQNGGEYKFVEE